MNIKRNMIILFLFILFIFLFNGNCFAAGTSGWTSFSSSGKAKNLSEMNIDEMISFLISKNVMTGDKRNEFDYYGYYNGDKLLDTGRNYTSETKQALLIFSDFPLCYSDTNKKLFAKYHYKFYIIHYNDNSSFCYYLHNDYYVSSGSCTVTDENNAEYCYWSVKFGSTCDFSTIVNYTDFNFDLNDIDYSTNNYSISTTSSYLCIDDMPYLYESIGFVDFFDYLRIKGYITEDFRNYEYVFWAKDSSLGGLSSFFIFSHNPIVRSVANGSSGVYSYYLLCTTGDCYYGIYNIQSNGFKISLSSITKSIAVFSSSGLRNASYKILYADKPTCCTNHDIYQEGTSTIFMSTEEGFEDLSHIYDDPSPSLRTEQYTLYLNDQNLMKSFRFTFNIPMLREDTKFYCFLDSYHRNNYNSVTANFKIYTVTTPEGYDYTEYENYLYYDQYKDKLFFPAGCDISVYSCSVNNGCVADLTLDNSFVGSRVDVYFVENSTYIKDYIKDIFVDNYEFNGDNFLMPTDMKYMDFNLYAWLCDLIPNFIRIANIPLDKILSFFGVSTTDELLFNQVTTFLYYALEDCPYNYSTSVSCRDLVFSNCDIVSYESLKSPTFAYGFKGKNPYQFFRKTSIFNYLSCYCLNGDFYLRTITNGEDTSSYFDSSKDTSFLNSPFIKDCDNNVSGCFLTNDITSLLTEKSTVNYSVSSSQFEPTYKDTYINNYYYNYVTNNEGDHIDNSSIDNSVVNNNYNTIENTGGDDMLSKIYWQVYCIRMKMDDISFKVENTTNNFNYNTKNYFKSVFVPDRYKMNELKGDIEQTAEDHLGILYQPWQFIIYTLELFAHIDDYDNIVLQTPMLDVSYGGESYVLLYSKVVNFSEIFRNSPTLKYMHEFYLSAVDFTILILLGKTAARVGKEKSQE